MKLNFLETIKDKLFILCNPNGDELKIIDHREEHLDTWLNDIWALTFTVDNLNKHGDYNDYYDLIVKDRIIKIQDVAEFIIIDDPEIDNGTSKVKQVTCKSLEYESVDKNINYLECKAYKFYDTIPENISNTFLGIIMSKLPNWTIGEVDIELYNKYRVFDISSDTNIYNLSIEQAQAAYECIFQFDRLNKTVNVYTRDNVVKDTDIIISFDNLVNEIGINPINDGYCNMLVVTGANDMGINLINPLGTNEIYNLDSIIDMTDSSGIRFVSGNTSNAWKAWKIKYDELKVGYAVNVLSIKNKNGQILTTRTQLQTLNAEIKALKESISIFNDFNEDKTALVDEYNAKVAEANDLESAIVTLNNEIQALLLQQTTTNNTLKFENFFTSVQLKELDRIIKPASYTDENFAITDSMTDVQIIEMSQELFDKGVRELEVLSKRRYSFDIDMLCPFFVDNFEVHKQQLELGAKITLIDSKGNYYNPLLIGLSFDFDNLSDVKFTFSESLRNQDSGFNISQLLGKTNSVATNLAINNIKYNSFIDSGGKETLHKYRTEALNADLNGLINGDDKTVTIDNTGILFRALDSNGINGYSPYQSWWNNNILMFSDNYFKNAKMGIGLITLPNNQKKYGINAEVILGDLIIGSSLGIHNANNSFRVDENGAVLENATLSIVANGGLNKILQDAVNGFKIQKKNGNIFEDMIYLGSDGEAYFKGKIFGGSINIGNRFILDDTGYLTLSNGLIKQFQSFTDGGKGLKIDGKTLKHDGDAEFTGSLKIGGSVTWFGNPSPVKYQYSDNNINWHDSELSTDKYRRESWDGGTTWQFGYQYKGKDGINGTNGSDANVDDVNVFNALTNGGMFQGVFFSNTGKLYMNAQYIRTGTLSGVTVNVDTNLKVGNKIEIGDWYSQDEKIISFNDGGYISYDYDSMTIASYDMTISSHQLEIASAYTYARGEWDFRSANVIGITAKFA